MGHLGCSDLAQGLSVELGCLQRAWPRQSQSGDLCFLSFEAPGGAAFPVITGGLRVELGASAAVSQGPGGAREPWEGRFQDPPFSRSSSDLFRPRDSAAHPGVPRHSWPPPRACRQEPTHLGAPWTVITVVMSEGRSFPPH